MQFLQRVGRAIRGAPRPIERLGDFTLAGRLGPVAAFAVLSMAMFAVSGYSASLALLLELCAAYAVAFVALAALRAAAGPNPRWSAVLTVAAIGVVAGAYAAAVIAEAPNWRMLTSWTVVAQHRWQMGAAFSAFFVGLSLVTAAIREREHAEFQTRQNLLEARLKMLTARIEPHFLLNTLANLRYLVKSDSDVAYAMLDHLSDFLQGALERSRDLSSTLGQEIQLIESYLSIMQIRLGDKLRFHIDLDAALEGVAFPALLLQTLVENAVTHGIEPADGPGLISIDARASGGQCVVTVADNGVGFDPSHPGIEGVGLQNVRERLHALFDAEASLHIESSPGSGTIASVVVPLRPT